MSSENTVSSASDFTFVSLERRKMLEHCKNRQLSMYQPVSRIQDSRESFFLPPSKLAIVHSLVTEVNFSDNLFFDICCPKFI